MAISTIFTYLMDGGAASGAASFGSTALIAIKDIPDLEGEKEEIEVTSLSDDSRTFVEGLKNNASWTFTCNYEKADYEALKLLDGIEKHYGVFLGDISGTDGKFTSKGFLSVRKMGGGVGEAQEMSVKIVLTADVTEA